MSKRSTWLVSYEIKKKTFEKTGYTILIIDSSYYERCIRTLNNAYSLLNAENADTIEYDMYRSACIKEFEIILEQSGKLLRKILKPFFHSSKEADKLYFKDLFRHAVLHILITDETCER